MENLDVCPDEGGRDKSVSRHYQIKEIKPTKIQVLKI